MKILLAGLVLLVEEEREEEEKEKEKEEDEEDEELKVEEEMESFGQTLELSEADGTSGFGDEFDRRRFRRDFYYAGRTTSFTGRSRNAGRFTSRC